MEKYNVIMVGISFIFLFNAFIKFFNIYIFIYNINQLSISLFLFLLYLICKIQIKSIFTYFIIITLILSINTFLKLLKSIPCFYLNRHQYTYYQNLNLLLCLYHPHILFSLNSDSHYLFHLFIHKILTHIHTFKNTS